MKIYPIDVVEKVVTEMRQTGFDEFSETAIIARLDLAIAKSRPTPIEADSATPEHTCVTCKHGQCIDMCASCSPAERA